MVLCSTRRAQRGFPSVGAWASFWTARGALVEVWVDKQLTG